MKKEVPKEILEKLIKLSDARSALYLGGFLTESENTKVANKLIKHRQKLISEHDRDFVK